MEAHKHRKKNQEFPGVIILRKKVAGRPGFTMTLTKQKSQEPTLCFVPLPICFYKCCKLMLYVVYFKYRMFHKFSRHSCMEAMLIFSVSFQF